MSNTDQTIEQQMDDILCKFATGYTRAELLEYPEEDTGLDAREIVGELVAVDKAHEAILQLTIEAREEGMALTELDRFDGLEKRQIQILIDYHERSLKLLKENK